MHTVATLLALASPATAILGFNYGSTFTTGAAKQQADFEAEFTRAANLEGTSGWTSARLYTMVQGGTASDPISAIPAAIKTKTTLLLGLWASGGDTSFANEILALKAAIAQFGADFTSIVDGISVGSEDLYRNSPMGIAAGSYVGAQPDTLAGYIKQTRDVISGTGLEGVPVGHVDTWTGWYNGSNQAVIDACDFLGMDAYPYFQDTMPNAIGQSKSLFQEALGKTQQAGGGKPVWITETGQPVSGKTVGQSVASTENAEDYWKTVGCPMFGNTNVWWYTLQDAAPDTPNPSFGIIGSDLNSKPLFDLSCDGVDTETSSSSASPSSTSAAASGTASGAASGTDSSSAVASTETASESLGDSGGSPGGVPSSQVSLQNSATVTPTAVSPSETGAGSSGSGSGTGASSNGTSPGSASGSGSSANGTVSAPPSGTSSINPPVASAGRLSVAFGSVLIGLVFAMSM
ncbi:glycoside hydrolase family 17 protein [Xylariomycetidae sp. FL2044]|nr:glycoside hydrolase family 17 protein [Xylariomycetidae sp. FL2044]